MGHNSRLAVRVQCDAFVSVVRIVCARALGHNFFTAWTCIRFRCLSAWAYRRCDGVHAAQVVGSV